MSEPDVSRRGIIEAVTTPLGFLVLGLLIVDGTIAGLAVALEEYRPLLIWTIIVSVPLFVFTVVGLAVWRPEALAGARPWQEVYAQAFADDLFAGLDGALSNLEPLEREEAWTTVADVITSEEGSSASYIAFCLAVAVRLRRRANLSNRRLRTQGPVSPAE